MESFQKQNFHMRFLALPAPVLGKMLLRTLFHSILGPIWKVYVGKEMCISIRIPVWVLEILNI